MYNVESHGLSNKTTTAHNVKASLITDTSAKPDIIYIGRFLGSRTTELHTAKLAAQNVVLLVSNFGLPSWPHCVSSLADPFERSCF